MKHGILPRRALFADLARRYESLGDTYAFTAIRNVIKLLKGTPAAMADA